jgi:hypothetical protein
VVASFNIVKIRELTIVRFTNDAHKKENNGYIIAKRVKKAAVFCGFFYR